MSLAQFYYLATIFIFAGIPLFISLVLFRKRLWVYRKLLAVMALISVVMTVIMEPSAIATQSWVYNYSDMFNVHVFGAEIETFLFSSFLVLFVVVVTVFVSEIEERNEPFAKHVRHWIKKCLRI